MFLGSLTQSGRGLLRRIFRDRQSNPFDTRIQELLSNEAFTTKAPEKVVNQNRQRLAELADRLEQLEAGLRES